MKFAVMKFALGENPLYTVFYFRDFFLVECASIVRSWPCQPARHPSKSKKFFSPIHTCILHRKKNAQSSSGIRNQIACARHLCIVQGVPIDNDIFSICEVFHGIRQKIGGTFGFFDIKFIYSEKATKFCEIST